MLLSCATADKVDKFLLRICRSQSKGKLSQYKKATEPESLYLVDGSVNSSQLGGFVPTGGYSLV